MEESSVADMETDVSSTTEDVPENQEVTGSNGNVEMVIVVEQVIEEESNMKDEKMLLVAEDSITTAAEKSPQKDILPPKTVTKSPSKDAEPQKSPAKTGLPQNLILKKTPIKLVQLSPLKSVAADSSIKIQSLNPDSGKENSVKKSPLKPAVGKETVQISVSPQYEKEMNIEKSPTKPSEVNKNQQKPTEIQNEIKINTEKSPTKPPETMKTEQNTMNPVKVHDKIETSTEKSLDKPLETKKSEQKSSAKEIPLQEPKKSQIKEPDDINKANIDTKAEIVSLKSLKIKEVEPRSVTIPMDIAVEKEASNDTQLDTFTDVSEKEHNKSISRELKSLINSAKESKIISECTQLTSKTRKSRVALDNTNTSLNTSIEADKIHGARRSSNNSQMSNCSEKSDKSVQKRSMRSQNPEFVTKVKQFLSSVTGKGQKDDDDATDDELEENKTQDKNNDSTSRASTPKKRKAEDVSNKESKLRLDPYCWRCHWAVEQFANEKLHVPRTCTVCPRAFHFKCLSSAERNKMTSKNWVCPDCMIILNAESSETRSPAMKKISLGMLCELLKYALERMMDLNGVEPFMTPVDRVEFPDYDNYVVHPMDLSLMKANIAGGLYGSTEAFLADAQWILHNSIIFNTLQSKLTSGARGLVRSCRAEMGEIEACPECYAAAHGRRPTWFTDVCSTPHVLLWAKLKGFPHWPAKGMSVSSAGLVDVRFFGAHDRAWVPAKDCYLYSEKDPNNFRTKRQDILDSMQEAEQHIRNISRKYGKFVYPPFKTQFEPAKLNEQLKMMIPAFEGEVRTPVKEKHSNASPTGSNKKKSRSNSKSSKGSVNDVSDISETDDPLVMPPTNAMDGVETSKDIDCAPSKDKAKDVDMLQEKDAKDTEASRKRRRSELEEAVITILENTTSEKRKRVEEDKPEEEKSISQEPSSNIEVQEKPKKEIEKNKDATVVDKSITEETSEANTGESSSTVKVKSVPTKETINKTIRLTPIAVKPGSISNKLTPKANNNKDDSKASTPLNRSLLIPITSTPKDEKTTTPKNKQRSDKSLIDKLKSKNENIKSEKRRNSKSNKSLNGNNPFKNAKVTIEKKEKNGVDVVSKKDKANESNNVSKDKDLDKSNTVSETVTSPSNEASPKSAKDRSRISDDKSLAVKPRGTTKSTVVTPKTSSMPTITCVRSLSTISQICNTTITKTTASSKTVEVTIEAHPHSSIFTPTSTENIRNVKDAASKLQKLRNETEPLVGRVGVRAFARMTSPEKQKNDDVQVEIKAEPVDLDDADRQMEKMDLMNAFRLRPVNPLNNLREMRMNKVVVAPLTRMPAEVRPRAKKTFPTPKKPEDGQLNGKNSMVYIPIQPPVTQAPVRPSRPIANGPLVTSPVIRPAAPVNTSIANSVVNTLTPPLVPVMTSSLSSPMPTTAPTTTSPAIQSVPTIGQVPTTVHTVPLMTSVNGQWMFSLQPIMSVGGVDTTPSPLVNGHSDRSNQAPMLVPAAPAPPVAPATLAPLTLTPTSTNSRTAADTTSNTPGELPRLQQRPSLHHPLDALSPLCAVPPPSTAGPLTAKLNQNAVKLTDFFRTLLEDSLEKLDEPPTQVAALRLQLEQTKWRHQQQIEEVKHNYELTMAEMRASFEKDKARAVNEARRLAVVELEAAVKLTKTKQWCANCSQEAQFYCCWNTSYCDYPCQRAHWSQHFSVCTQQRAQDGSNGSSEGSNPPESRLQPQPDNLPKSSVSAAPALTVGGKLAPSRPPHDSSAPQKTSIIVSMVEDNSGNQTMKCLGTYNASKSAGATSVQVSPLLINKQLMTEESNKKVVTSGGYLIVGAGAGNASVMTPSRRATHTIQYYT